MTLITLIMTLVWDLWPAVYPWGNVKRWRRYRKDCKVKTAGLSWTPQFRFLKIALFEISLQSGAFLKTPVSCERGNRRSVQMSTSAGRTCPKGIHRQALCLLLHPLDQQRHMLHCHSPQEASVCMPVVCTVHKTHHLLLARHGNYNIWTCCFSNNKKRK